MAENITFLSKNGTDEYINMFASSFGIAPTSDKDFSYENTTGPIVLRGILKHKIMKQCLEDNRDFYYMDSGYMGNYKSPSNPNGWKVWHRIVKNNLQHSNIVERDSDRFDKLQVKLPDWKKNGRNILLVMPSEKPAKYFGIDNNQWRQQTIETIKKYTDRPIVIREKAKRQERISKTIYEEFDNAFAVVTLQSIAATEAILYGIPAFTLEQNAASKFAGWDLSKIETPTYVDRNEIYKWACHLAYGQFHNNELQDGTAKKILGL